MENSNQSTIQGTTVVAPETTATAKTTGVESNNTASVTFKCTEAQKSLLIKKATDECGLTVSEYVKYRVFNDAPNNMPKDEPVQEVITDEEKSALESLISRQRAQIAELNDQIYKLKTAEPVQEKPQVEAAVYVDTEKIKADAITEFMNGKLAMSATDELKKIVEQVNSFRKTKGLAPLEQSLAEILLHYSNSLDERDIFRKTTGMNYNDFYTQMEQLALDERTANGIQSNIIEDTGLLSSLYKIVDTKSEVENGNE